jgi:hypothetical protein
MAIRMTRRPRRDFYRGPAHQAPQVLITFSGNNHLGLMRIIPVCLCLVRPTSFSFKKVNRAPGRSALVQQRSWPAHPNRWRKRTAPAKTRVDRLRRERHHSLRRWSTGGGAVMRRQQWATAQMRHFPIVVPAEDSAFCLVRRLPPLQSARTPGLPLVRWE